MAQGDETLQGRSYLRALPVLLTLPANVFAVKHLWVETHLCSCRPHVLEGLNSILSSILKMSNAGFFLVAAKVVLQRGCQGSWSEIFVL